MDDIFMPLIGGLLIGLASTLMLLGTGRITGISGIFSQVLISKKNLLSWRGFFILGLIFGGTFMVFLFPSYFNYSLGGSSTVKVIIAGFLVGIGTRLGSGCTSGHGVCGIPRLSKRSIIATLTFMFSGMVTVFLLKGLAL